MPRPRRSVTKKPILEESSSSSEEEEEQQSSDHEDADDGEITKDVTEKPASKRQRESSSDAESDDETTKDVEPDKDDAGIETPVTPVAQAKKEPAVDDDNEPISSLKKPRRGLSPKATPKQTPKITPKSTPKQRDPIEKRTCPRCAKVVASAKSLKYHVDHNVCTKDKPITKREERAAIQAARSMAEAVEVYDNPKNKRGRPSNGAAATTSTEDRTCPLCHKSYATAYGIKYHTENKLCQKPKSNKKAKRETTPKSENSGSEEDEKDEETIVDDADDGDEGSNQEEEASTPGGRASRRTKRGKQSPMKSPQGRGPVEIRTCPHCFKICSSATGLKYHVDNMVCRKPEGHATTPKKPKVTPKKKRPRKRAMVNVVASPKGKRFRGTREDRVCNNCKKEFTSILGRDYHIKHRVCRDQRSDSLAGSIAFPSLEEGMQFITNYGIVEVCVDDRITPTYRYPDDIKQLTKKHALQKDKMGASKRRIQVAYGFQSRLRRRRWARAYEFDNVNHETTTKAYFGGSALAREAIAREVSSEPSPTLIPRDPFAPPEASPDRIVVCKPIADCRPTFYSLEQEEGIVKAMPGFSANMYLRRSELTKPYTADITVYICPDCGQKYNSREGFSYHINSNVCFNRSKARGVQRQEMNEATQVRLERYVKRANAKHKRKRRSEVAVYPQVWLTLGFKLKDFKKQVKEEKGDEITVERRVKQVDQTLQNLRDQVQQTTMKVNNEKLGAMYPQVFKSLGFKKPSKKKKPPVPKLPRRRRKRRKSGSGDGDEEGEEVEEEGEYVDEPPPQIMDMHVLIDEARSGRYPSIKRYTGVYSDKCVICKEGGKMLMCDFCSNAVHLPCLLSRITFNELDPEEDFLCHSCARKIVARRNRAEKRRLVKQQTVLDNARQKAANAASDDTEQSDYHVAAAVGKELSELLELLEDSRHRLHHMTEASRLNNFRRAQL